MSTKYYTPKEKQWCPNSDIMEHVLLNDFTIQHPYNSYMKVYFILSWSAKYISQKIQSGTITKNNIKYRAVYYRGKRSKVETSGTQYLLSFRQADTKLYPELVPTVLITPKEH